MKREYIKPIAMEELFLANSYVAWCATKITTLVKGVKIGCINPNHGHDYWEFGKVWVDGDQTTCTVKIKPDAVNTTLVKNWLGSPQSNRPAQGAIVYGVDGSYVCDTRKGDILSSGGAYYVPTFTDGTDPHYGSYLDKGVIDEVVSDEKVLS